MTRPASRCRAGCTSAHPTGCPASHTGTITTSTAIWAAGVDVGADVRLGRTTSAYADGACEGWLPPGSGAVRVTRGFDYQPLDAVVAVGDHTRELTLRVRRLFDPGQGRLVQR